MTASGIFCTTFSARSRRATSWNFRFCKNQINPHFLHNTLNTIRYMAYVQKEENIVTVVTAFPYCFGTICAQNEYLTIEEEAQSLRSYPEIQTFNTAENTSIQLRLCRDQNSIESLKMLIQPLVENALANGIAPSDRPGLSRCRCFGR